MRFENPQFLLLLLVLPAMAMLWYWRGMRTVPAALALRLLVVALIVVAVANPTSSSEIETSGPIVLLVDQSDSLTPEGQASLRNEAERLAHTIEDHPGGQAGEVAVLWFGANTIAPGDWHTAAATDQPPDALREAVDPSASDLAGGLRAARQLLAASTADTGEAGHIVLLSDGMQTSGDALAEARLAAESGLIIDSWPLERAQTPELSITNLSAPDTLHAGEEYTVRIVIHNNSDTAQASLRLWDGSQLLGEEQVNLAAGDNSFTFRSQATRPGVIRLRAEVTGEPDTFAANNYAAAAPVVAAPQRVLIVEGRDGIAADLSASLWNAGIESEVIAPARMPTRLSHLAQFDGMVLVDVPAQSFSLDQMTTVQEFVRSEGRGLVVTGGTNSFGLGAYKDTPLEQVLPVSMEAPPRPERSEVALLLIIDRSASMDTALGVSKFDMAKEAAILATETLRNEDTIGVLAFDTGQQWSVPFQRISDGSGLKQIQDNIATIPTGGGTDIYNALSLGLGELRGQPASVRHVVLLTDGRSFTDDRVAYQQLAESALAQDITLSTIAIGFDSDTELLEDLARWGGGRYYFADAPEDIPRLTLQESEIARSDPSVEGTFLAELVKPHPLLRDFAPVDLPQLDGYVATTPKPAAEIILHSPEDDPVLAAWQYGLGRAVAWTPSVADPWAAAWNGWPDYGRFWAQVVRYTLPEADSGPLQIRLVPQSGGARLVADAVQDSGAPLDLADAVARVTLPDGTENTFELRQVGPGAYAQDLRLPGAGAYGVAVVLERNGEQYFTEAGYVQPVAREYMPVQAERDQLQGIPLLEQLAQMTGGQVLESSAVFQLPGQRNTDSPPAYDPFSRLWMWLLGAALLVWLLEIAVRRGLFVRDS